MTRTLRAAHRRIVAVMAVTLPPLVLVAILGRGPVPSEALPPLLETPDVTDGFAVTGLEEIRAGLRWARVPAATLGGNALLVIACDRDLRVPDLLVYWSPDSPPTPEAVPGDAWLLGALSGSGFHRYALPSAASAADGAIVLYSLARRDAIATWPVRPGATGGR